MMTRLTLTNFMAHAATTFEFPPGLSVLTGPNNTGKSAVVEALRCLTQNPAPRHVIRHGADEARVSLTLSDGTTVTWVRRPRYALYELARPGAAEPEVFAKFGRTPPAEILDILRLDLVPLEIGDPVDVHIGNQREPVFLLNQPGTAVAGFFAASSEAAHLVAMQNRLTDRARKGKAEARRLEGQLAALAASLDTLAPLPELEYRLGNTATLETALAVLDREMPALERVLSERQTLRQRLEHARVTTRILVDLKTPPQLEPTDVLVATISQGQVLTAAKNTAAARAAFLSRLAPPPVLVDTALLADTLAHLSQTAAACDRQTAKVAALSPVEEPPELFATAPLAALLDQMAANRRDFVHRRETACRLLRLSGPPEIGDTRGLAEVLAGLTAARQAVAAQKTTVRECARALEACEATVAARLETLGVCPLCGGTLHTAEFLGTQTGQRTDKEAV